MIDLHSRIIYINCVSKLIKWRQNLNALKYTALFHRKMVAKKQNRNALNKAMTLLTTPIISDVVQIFTKYTVSQKRLSMQIFLNN